MPPRSVAVLVAVAALGLPASPASARIEPRPAVTCAAAGVQRVGDPTHALAVVAGPRGLVARVRPASGAPAVGRFGARTPEGVTSVFLVRDRILGAGCAPAWFRVLLPMRPNGASGWIPASGLVRYVVRTRIVVDVSSRRLRLYRTGKLVRTLPVAVGRAGTPTPIGLFYVTERLYTDDPGGAYGPAALGLSAFSPTLTQWVRGGPVGIHGTDEPASIGQAASNGCVRVPNADAVALLRATPAGTPVVIHP